MSFRTRLTGFFVVIVVLPMIAVGVLVFRLISDSEQGKADARAAGLASAAASLYETESSAARGDAALLAHELDVTPHAGIAARAVALASAAGLARLTIASGSVVVADFGSSSAIAPGAAVLGSGRGRLTVTASELTAGEYSQDLTSSGAAVVIEQGSRVLASTLSVAGVRLPRRGSVTIGRREWDAASETFSGFGSEPVTVTVLSSMASTPGSLTGSRVLAAIFIAGFLLLAFAFSVLASRGLQGQLSRFLAAARRLASGDFSAPIQIEGRDEFAALGEEFNNMSSQLERRLDELSQERARLREAIGRVGQTFESNLDGQALLELLLTTAVDAVQAESGRVSLRASSEDPLSEVTREGSLDGAEEAVYEAERAALHVGGLGDSDIEGTWVLSVPLTPIEAGGRIHGLITVARRDRPFSEDDRALLRSLSSQATLALENVDLHEQVARQAVTDELTGLANHGRFQELLASELEQVRRYHHPLGLIMLDIDNFKSVNDTFGHQQGDLVLRRVAMVLADTSRETDYPARYGGEEMALILPHTDLEGSYVIAERIRTRVEALRVPRRDQQGTLQISVSLGVAVSNDGEKDDLIADADGALYQAKRQGKNQTVRARERAANVAGGG